VLGESPGEAGAHGPGGPGELHPGIHGEPLVPRTVESRHVLLKHEIVEH
jgi:hypothetical protein